MENCDLGTDTEGRPMTGVEVRLVDWEEGNYKVTDRPNPRGEIILGGDSIAKVIKTLQKQIYSLTWYTYLPYIFTLYNRQTFHI